MKRKEVFAHSLILFKLWVYLLLEINISKFGPYLSNVFWVIITFVHFSFQGMRFFYPLTVLKFKDNILVPNDARKRNLQNSKIPSLLIVVLIAVSQLSFFISKLWSIRKERCKCSQYRNMFQLAHVFKWKFHVTQNYVDVNILC